MIDRRALNAQGRDGDPAESTTEWTKPQRAVLAAFAAAVCASLAWLVHPWFDMNVDASIYIITARSLAAGDGYTYLGEPFLIRPPGFSLLLAPVIAAFDTDFAALNSFVGVWGAAGVVLLVLFARPRLGFSLALLVALAVWLNPGYQRFTTQIMSDVPGVALLLICLLVERWARAAPSLFREVVLGLCIGLSTYVRSLLLLLVPAIAASRLLRARAPGGSWWRFAARQSLPFAAVAVAILAPWSLRNRLDAPSEPSDQTMFHSYAVAVLHADPADPDSRRLDLAEILARVPLRARQIAGVLGSRLKQDYIGSYDPAAELQPAEVTLALGLLGSSLAVLWRRREPAELTVAGSLVVIATYFGFGGRLLLPVFVLSLVAAAEVIRGVALRAAGARAGEVVAGVLVLALIALDFEPRRGWYEIEREHRGYVESSRAIASAVGPDERLGAPVGAHYSVFLERPVYNLLHAVRRARSIGAAERVIERHQLDAVVLSESSPFDAEFVPYFRGRYGAPERVGPALIWRFPDHRPSAAPQDSPSSGGDPR